MQKSTGYDNFMQVVDDVKFTHPADLEHKLDHIKFIIENRLVAIEQIVKVILLTIIYHILYLM